MMVCRSFSFIITAIYREVFWFYDGPWPFWMPLFPRISHLERFSQCIYAMGKKIRFSRESLCWHMGHQGELSVGWEGEGRGCLGVLLTKVWWVVTCSLWCLLQNHNQIDLGQQLLDSIEILALSHFIYHLGLVWVPLATDSMPDILLPLKFLLSFISWTSSSSCHRPPSRADRKTYKYIPSNFYGVSIRKRCIPQSLSRPLLCGWSHVSSPTLVSWWRKKSNDGWTMRWLSSFYLEVAHIVSKKFLFTRHLVQKQFKFFFVLFLICQPFLSYTAGETAPISNGLQQRNSNSCFMLCRHASSGSKAALSLWLCSSVFFILDSRLKE